MANIIQTFITMLIVLQVSTLISISASLIEIKVSHGKLSTANSKGCAINNNNYTFKVDTNEFTEYGGLYFGLITYICNNTSGYIISKLDCKDCGIYCTYNNYIDGCKNDGFLFWSGLLSGLLISITLGLLLHFFIYKMFGLGINHIVYLYQLCTDKREKKFSQKVSNVTGSPSTPNYKTSRFLKPKYYKKINQKRMGEIPEDVYIELDSIPPVVKNKNKNINTNSDNNDFSQVKEQTIPDKEENGGSTSGVSNAVRAVLFSAALLNNSTAVYGCDINLYMSSNNQLCDGNVCRNMNSYTFPLMSGGEVCFKDLNGELTKFKIIEIGMIKRYSKLYYTSNYTLNTETSWDCMYNNMCEPSTCHDGFVNDKFKRAEPIESYGCDVVVSACDEYCFRDGSCSYYHWYIKKQGPLYPIYKHVGQIWYVKIGMTSNSVYKIIDLNSNNPTFNILGERLSSFNKVPILVTSFISEEVIYDKNIVIINSKAYSVVAAEINMPQHEIIGDYQISLNLHSETFSNAKVKCKTDSCITRCVMNEPSISRFINTLNNNLQITRFNYVGSSDKLNVIVPTHGTINLMVGNIDVKSLLIEYAKCEIDVVMTYGCLACQDMPYAVLQAYNIKNEGILPFESNCSFSTNYLSCNSEPYTLKLEEIQKTCAIVIININKTLIVNIEYKYNGDLTPQKVIMPKETSIGAVVNAIQTPEFLTSLATTAMTCTIIGTTLTVILRIVKIFVIKKTIDEPN